MTIENVTQTAFDAVREQLLDTHQVEMTGTNEGTISAHGVTANYCFDPTLKTVVVEVKHHPFFIPVSAIEHNLREAFAKAVLA
jgi:hypothetical protein